VAQGQAQGRAKAAGGRLTTVHTRPPGELILAEHGEPIGVGTLAIPESQRVALIDLLERYGRQHPSGTILISDDRIQAIVHYTLRTPTHGHLREAFLVAVEPIGADGPDEVGPAKAICASR
jgi:hypothetical protein